MKIVSYVDMNADKFKAKICNTQIDFTKEINPEQYKQYGNIEEFKRNNPNVVRCIPLDDIDSFSLTEELTQDQIEKIYEEGFVSNGTDEYGHYYYIRKELLEQ